MEFPDIRYAQTEGLRIAYQTWGSGPPLVIVPQLVSNIEIHNEHEYYRRVREHMGRYFTCLEFDKRGIGLSDRFAGELPTTDPVAHVRVGVTQPAFDPLSVGFELPLLLAIARVDVYQAVVPQLVHRAR